MTKNRETRTVQNPAVLAVGARRDVLVWRQQAGLYRAYDNPDRIVRVGLAGMSDAGMIVAMKITPDLVGKTVGVAVQPEFKTSQGKQRAEQLCWQRAVEQRGGVYAIVRSADEMLELVDRVQRGEF